MSDEDLDTRQNHCGECEKIVLYELLNGMCGPCFRRFIEEQRGVLP